MPDNEKLLEKLLRSKEVCDIKSNTLVEYLDGEIHKVNFENATGLRYTTSNEKLLLIYKKIENEIRWRDFKKISKHIINFETLEKIGSKKVKRMYQKHIIFWGTFLCLIAISFVVLYFKYSYSALNLTALNNLALPLIFFGYCQVNLMNQRDKLQLIKRYDSIIENKKTP